MNRIRAQATSRQFNVHQPPLEYLALVVDGLDLNEWLKTQSSEFTADWNVPSMMGSNREALNRLIWERILPAAGCTSFCPVLRCPECADLDCGVVMIEVSSAKHVVSWVRFGFDHSQTDDFGIVRWISGPNALTFERAEYETCLAAFKARYIV